MPAVTTRASSYNYDNTVDSTPNDATSPTRYPDYLVMQNFETYDGNLRVTFRPRQNVTAITRYEYQVLHCPHEPGSRCRA